MTRARLRELAYTNVQDMIATRKIKPGEYINERALSNDLGIGRTPTRQALERLTLDRLVQFIPGRGSIARPIGSQELLQIIETRLANEELSARLAARHATEDDIGELNEIVSRAEHWTSRRNIERLLLLDRSFHAKLARMGTNAFLPDILPNLHERSLGYWFMALETTGRIDEIAREHAAIFEAVKQRDEERAAAKMSCHIKSLYRAIAGAFASSDIHALSQVAHKVTV